MKIKPCRFGYTEGIQPFIRCETHDWPCDGDIPSDERCLVGQIEEAIAEGVKQIRAEIKQIRATTK